MFEAVPVKANIEYEYLNLLRHVLSNGNIVGDRTGTGTLSIFGAQLRHDLSVGFPLLTTKKVFWRGVAEELLWMLRGETNVKSLQEKGVHIWDAWADAHGELGPVYGHQWRFWGAKKKSRWWASPDTLGLDQIANVIERIKTNPNCRRLIVTAWNPEEIDSMKLPPCHCFFQFKVYGNKLSCQLYQRSADLFLGVPFNIASYALLTHLVAHVCGLEVGEFIHTFGDAHIYLNHISQVKEQLAREPKELPSLVVIGKKDINTFAFDDLTLKNYNPAAAIAAPVSV